MINFVDDIVLVKDPAGQELSRNRAEKTIKAALFQLTAQASEMAQRYLAINGWPARTITLQSRRSLFRLQSGDPFVLASGRYALTGAVYRVATVSEENPENGAITITAALDWRYVSALPLEVVIPPLPTPAAVEALNPLTSVRVIEAPYPGSGDELTYIATMAGRRSGNETGYAVYYSLDGEAYERIGTAAYFSVVGALTAEYPAETCEIDDETGITCTIAMDAGSIQSITRAQMFGLANLAMLNDEIISFQTITPTATENEYRLTGIVRARYDTEPADHGVGDKLYWVGGGGGAFLPDQAVAGATRYFKLVPYSPKRSGLPDDATALEITINGRSRKPYRPTNLKCNDMGVNPVYADDCTLAWQPRLRTEGAGFGDANTVTDAAPAWEGLFRVRVYVNSALVRTTSAIDAIAWTYTEAMNIADNGGLAASVVFRLTNYRTISGVEYESAYTELEVLQV